MRVIVACGLSLFLVQASLAQEETPEQMLSQAIKLHRSGDLPSAIRAYETILARYPDVADVRLNLGTAYASAGDQEKAIEQYQRALSLVTASDPDKSADIRALLGAVRLRAGDYFQAAAEFERAVELDPTRLSLNATLGNVLRELQKLDEADAAYRRELKLNPADFDSNLYHGVYLYKYQQKYDESIAHLESALRTRPGNADARFQMGLVYSLSNRPEKAVEIIKTLAEERPNSLEIQTTLARLYHQLGRSEDAERHRALADRSRKDQAGQLLIQQGRFSEAIEIFNQLKRMDPAYARAYFFSGMALTQMKEWSAAAGELREAVRRDPGNPNYIIPYANALARLGQSAGALAGLRQVPVEALQQLPPEAIFLLSETYHRVGNHDEALKALDILAQRDPYSPRISMLRGQIYLVKGDRTTALSFLERSIQLQPANNALAYSLLGRLRYESGAFSQAKEAFLKAANQDSGNPEYLWRLGAACLALGESGDALQYLEKARPAAEEFPEIYSALATAYEAQQNEVKAKEALEQYRAAMKRRNDAVGKPSPN